MQVGPVVPDASAELVLATKKYMTKDHWQIVLVG